MVEAIAALPAAAENLVVPSLEGMLRAGADLAVFGTVGLLTR